MHGKLCVGGIRSFFFIYIHVCRRSSETRRRPVLQLVEGLRYSPTRARGHWFAYSLRWSVWYCGFVGCDYRGLSVLSRVTEAPHLGEVIMVSFPCQFTGALCVAANEISAIALLCFGPASSRSGIGQHTQCAKHDAKSSKERGPHQTLA